MVTFETLFNFLLVLIAVAGGSYSIGYAIGKFSGKRK